MANKDAPFGFRSVGKLGGGVANGGVTEYSIATGATGDIFSGDPVKMLNTGTILVAGAATTLLGIFRGCRYTDSSGDVVFSSYFPTTTASSDIVAFVDDDPKTLFEVQCTGSLAQTAVGNNVELAYTAGSTQTGMSAAEISSTTAATTAQFRIVGFSTDPSNSTTGSANINAIVYINEHFYTTVTGV